MSTQAVFAIGLAVVGFCVFMIALIVGIHQADMEKTKQMEACVAAGGDWTRSGISSHFECKGVNR